MADGRTVLDPFLAAEGELAPTPIPHSGTVAVLVDGSVAAIAATAWAARLANEKHTDILVIVVLYSASSQVEDSAAAVARVQPTLDRSGRPYHIRTFVAATGMTVGRRAERTVKSVLQLLPGDASLLVCPGGSALAERLVASGPAVDLLVVPDLRSFHDALDPAGPRPTPTTDRG